MTEEEKENIIASIQQFIGYFKNQVTIVDSLISKVSTDEKLYVQKQTLLVSLIDSLSNIRFNKKNYPQLSKHHRERFIRFLIEYSNWTDGNMVCISFLRDDLVKNSKNGQLLENIQKSISKAEFKGNWLFASKLDMSIEELNSFASDEKEEEAILFYQHYSILYRYRNYLVHEARKPGYGMEFMSYDKDVAIYHSYINDPKLHLLYPMGMLKKIVDDASDNLQKYFIEKLIDPYDFVDDTLRF